MRKILLIVSLLLITTLSYGRDTGSRDSYRNALRNLKFDIIPAINDVRDLGSSTKRFNELFVTNVNLSGAGTFEQIIIDADNNEALLIRKDGDLGDVLTVDTGDPADNATKALEVIPNGGGFTGSANPVRGISVETTVNTGTQSDLIRGLNVRTITSGDAVASGVGDNGVRAGHFLSIHNSTGTTAELNGFNVTYGALTAGSSVDAGLLTDSYGIKLSGGFNSSSGSGSITNSYGVRVVVPSNTDATHTINNIYGLRVDNQVATGITNAWALKTFGGLVEFESTATDSTVLLLGATAEQTSNIFDIPNADSLTTGKIINIRSNSSNGSTRDLFRANNDNPGSANTTVMRLQQDSNGKGLIVDDNGNNGAGVLFDRDSNAAVPIAALEIQSDNAGAGDPLGIDMATFSAGEPLFNVPADAVDPTGGGVYGQITVNIPGVGEKKLVLYN